MLTIDILRRTVHKDGKEIVLKSKILMNMLIYLVKSNGMVRTREDILAQCWDAKIVTKRNVDIRLVELRKKINDPHPGKIIIGVNNIGYKINPDKVRLINQNGVAPSSESHDGYVFLKHAKLKGEPVIIMQSIKDVDDWIVIPKSEYNQ